MIRLFSNLTSGNLKTMPLCPPGMLSHGGMSINKANQLKALCARRNGPDEWILFITIYAHTSKY